MTDTYLPGGHPRARWMRLDAATLLKRFFFCEQALIVAQGGWLAAIPSFEIKTALPRLLWEDALTAEALRNRVFELRYPSRLMEVEDDAPLAQLFAAALHAPGPEALLLSLARVYKPALHAAYTAYLDQTDEIADGPTVRFLELAAREKARQIETLADMAGQLLAAAPQRRAEAEAWCDALQDELDQLGGVSLEPLPGGAPGARPLRHLPGYTPFELPATPARDPAFYLCRFYWPDIVDPNFQYGNGVRLQLRSAVSHLNEVWAVETAGAILQAFAEELGWEFVLDAARWCYDESRHCRMGYARLREWGFAADELPLGSYIYDSARGQDPIYRLGMLFFFETKNIGKKNERIRAFSRFQDTVSQHDMDYDWADETLHASYGQRWLQALLERRARLDEGGPATPDEVRARCRELVAAEVATATLQERAEIRAVAERLIEKAERLAQPM